MEMLEMIEGMDNCALIFCFIPSTILLVYLISKFVLYVCRSYIYCNPRTVFKNNDSPRHPARPFHRTVSDGETYECPICMELPSFMVETSCGHHFCAQCFCLHWKRTLYSRTISCPMCRGHVRSLTKLFTPEELENNETRRSLENDVNMFNRWHSGQPVSFMERLRDIPTLLHGLIQQIVSGEGTTTLLYVRLLFLGICVFFYLLSPFDFIPESVAGFFGFLDDLVVVFIFGVHAFAVYRTMAIRRQQVS